MPTFDFVCDARVSVSIIAETREEAQRAWDMFCINIETEACASLDGTNKFRIYLADKEPDVYDADGNQLLVEKKPDYRIERETRYVIYDFGEFELVTTMVYFDKQEAQDDADQLDNACVLPIAFEKKVFSG